VSDGQDGVVNRRTGVTGGGGMFPTLRSRGDALYCVSPTWGGVEIKIVAIRCQIFRLKFTKFDFAPDPAVEAYRAPHTHRWI